MLHFKFPAENHTGLQIEIVTSLSVLEQNFFLWVVILYVLRLCTRNFVILEEKLWSRQQSKAGYQKIAISAKKSKLCSFFRAIIFHLGSQNFVYTMPKHISYHCKQVLLYHTQGGGNSSFSGYRKKFFTLPVESVN